VRVLKGYGVGRKTINKIEGLDKIEKYDIFTNFNHYKFPLPEIMVSDFSRPPFHFDSHRGPLFDAIVCDPPYGVRARTHKVGVSESKQKRKERIQQEKAGMTEEELKEKEEEPHYAMKE
jgi:tRNA G10  N-methylase Trm11